MACGNGCFGGRAHATHWCADCHFPLCPFCASQHRWRPELRFHVLSEIAVARPVHAEGAATCRDGTREQEMISAAVTPCFSAVSSRLQNDDEARGVQRQGILRAGDAECPMTQSADGLELPRAAGIKRSFPTLGAVPCAIAVEIPHREEPTGPEAVNSGGAMRKKQKAQVSGLSQMSMPFNHGVSRQKQKAAIQTFSLPRVHAEKLMDCGALVTSSRPGAAAAANIPQQSGPIAAICSMHLPNHETTTAVSAATTEAMAADGCEVNEEPEDPETAAIVDGISEYEKMRLENIKRNQEILSGLGINSDLQRLSRPSPPKRRARPATADDNTCVDGGGRAGRGRPLGQGADPAAESRQTRSRTAVKVGDRMLGEYRNSNDFYPCVVTDQTEDGRWIVEWDDGDQEDTCKTSRQLRPLRDAAVLASAAQERDAPWPRPYGLASTVNVGLTGETGGGFPHEPDAARESAHNNSAAESGRKPGKPGKGRGKNWGGKMGVEHWRSRIGSRVTSGSAFVGLQHVFRCGLGAAKSKTERLFFARIKHNGMIHYLGTFHCSTSAARVADRKIVELGAPAQRLNFPEFYPLLRQHFGRGRCADTSATGAGDDGAGTAVPDSYLVSLCKCAHCTSAYLPNDGPDTSGGAIAVGQTVGIGARVRMLFDDGIWHPGTVLSYDAAVNKYVVGFTDGHQQETSIPDPDLRMGHDDDNTGGDDYAGGATPVMQGCTVPTCMQGMGQGVGQSAAGAVAAAGVIAVSGDVCAVSGCVAEGGEGSAVDEEGVGEPVDERVRVTAEQVLLLYSQEVTNKTRSQWVAQGGRGGYIPSCARPKTARSGFRGVYKTVKGNFVHWDAQVYFRSKTYNLGRFKTAEEAARVHDRKIRELGKDPSFLNFPDEEERKIAAQSLSQAGYSEGGERPRLPGEREILLDIVAATPRSVCDKDKTAADVGMEPAKALAADVLACGAKSGSEGEEMEDDAEEEGDEEQKSDCGLERSNGDTTGELTAEDGGLVQAADCREVSSGGFDLAAGASADAHTRTPPPGHAG